MLLDNLRLLFQLYRHPRGAMAEIVDEGSPLLGALGVIGVSLLFQLSLFGGSLAASARADVDPEAPLAELAPPADWSEEFDEQVPDPESPATGGAAGIALGLAMSSMFATVGNVAALALLYVPAALLVAGLLERRGSFGVAVRRDYGSLAACAFLTWTAAHLPFALAGSVYTAATAAGGGFGGSSGLWIPVGLWAAGRLAFAGCMVLALQVALGLRLPSAIATALLAPVALLGQGFLVFLASPFLLFCGWRYFQGDLGDIQWSLGARRSFKRHMEAATVNPRDAEAHYQLGLIHQQRMQIPEAIARFERAIEIDPDERDAHYQLGRIARQQQRHADAIRHFGAVVSRDASHAHHEVWREVGATYLEAGDLGNARTALERFVDKRAWDPEGQCLLGELLAALGESDAAREAFERCAESARTAPDHRRAELRRWRRRAEQWLTRLKGTTPGP